MPEMNIQCVHKMQANGLKLAAYRLRDPATGIMSSLQFHATYDNTVLAIMGEEGAKLFVRFVNQTLSPETK